MSLNSHHESSPISVLVAEDDVVFRRVMEWTLRRSGFKVIAVSDGVMALETLRNDRVDFVVTDHQMPGLTGIELFQIADREGLLIPERSILCTAKGFELDTEGLRDRFQLAAILSKPFSPKELVTIVSEAVHPDASVHQEVSTTTVS